MPLKSLPPDRTLYRRPTLRGRLRLWSMTQWIIAANVAAFVLDILSKGWLHRWWCFSVEDGVYHLQLWRFFTAQFLHADVGHIFFNMLWLYYLGPLVEARLQRQRYLAFYLICTLAGNASFVLLWRLHVLVYSPDTTLVGASAGVFGILMGAIAIAPNMMVRLWLPPVSLRLKTLVLIYLGIAALAVYSGSFNAGGEAAHLGGAAAGFLLIHNVHWLRAFNPKSRRQRFWRPGDPASSFFRRDEED